MFHWFRNLFRKNEILELLTNAGNITDMRVLLVTENCPFCRMMRLEVSRINELLAPENRIKVVHIDSFNPMALMFRGRKIGTPSLYLDGYLVQGTTSEEYIQRFLHGYFKSIGEVK